jgi:hypothetical protein
VLTYQRSPFKLPVENSDPSFQPLDLTFAFLLRFFQLFFQGFADFTQFVLNLQNFGFQCFDLCSAGRNDLSFLPAYPQSPPASP